ncbi:MAG: hypothetical protein JOZ05_09980, partial [Acetobacteraceae bacterium]|nr:hypothetical protein [Acetobacteraceae bacterium]
MWQRVLGLLVATGVGLAAATDAKATPFGPGTGSIAFTFSPTVTLGGSGNAAHANGTAIIFSTTSNLIGLTTGLGTVDGTLNFSTTVGTTVTESISNFLRF